MIGVITNSNARGIAADPMLPRRLAQIGGRSTEVVETRSPRELHDALVRFADAGVDVIAACGGDGTNLAVITELIQIHGPESLPRLAVLRGGTVNTVAANIGIRGSPEDILTRLVACRNRGMEEPVVVRPTLCVNGSCGFLFGAAMAARFFEAYYGGPFSGLGWAAALAARVTASSLLGTAFARRLFAPVPARITVDGKRLPQELWTLLVAATVENVGLQIRVTYRALERPGRFHLVASGLPPFELARQLHRTFLSRSLSGGPHFDLLAGEVVIELERPEPYIMDGDRFHAARLVLRQGPNVKLCLP